MRIMANLRLRLKPPEEHPNMIVYRKIEKFVDKMLDERDGVAVKTVKSFLSKVPSVFTGIDVVQWIMRNIPVDDQAEALHLAHQLACHGYLFPIDDHVLTVKNDNTFYRFQTPYFWPSNCWEPENTDYAVYLCKRTMQNKAHLELEDFEAENLAKLQKQFSRKWEFIFMQAEAQYKVDKKRDRLERQILDSQERAFWDVHRPVPGCVNTTEVDFRKLSRRSYRNHAINTRSSGMAPAQRPQIEAIKKEVELLETRLMRNVLKTSKVAETYINYWDQRQEFDGFLTPSEPANPWIHDSLELWLEDRACVNLSDRRVKRWTLSFEDLLQDCAGRDQFMRFLKKEYAAENLRFYDAVQAFKGSSNRLLRSKSSEIYEEFLGPNSTFPVNVDSKVVDITTKNLQNPTRNCFDEAQEHIYKLMKNDSYQRFIRSEMYKELSCKKKVYCEGSIQKSTFRIVPVQFRKNPSTNPDGSEIQPQTVSAQSSTQQTTVFQGNSPH